MNRLVKFWKWFESRTQATEDGRKAWRQQRFALHASDNPPAELHHAPPRKVRFIGEGVLLTFVTVIAIALPLVPVYFHHIVNQEKIESTRFAQEEYIKLNQIQDPTKRHRRENWIRQVTLDDDKRLSKGSTALRELTWMCFAFTLPYFLLLIIQLREMRLLQKGCVARGTVVRLICSKLGVVSFVNADGKEFSIKTLTPGFVRGDKVWLLYLPNRPKVACLYYLRRQPLMRVVSG
jgi:hypothetical protein